VRDGYGSTSISIRSVLHPDAISADHKSALMITSSNYKSVLFNESNERDYDEVIGIGNDLIPEIYTSRRVTHGSATAVFSDQKFPALQQKLDGRICCSEKT
jgi:hypothetical protein